MDRDSIIKMVHVWGGRYRDHGANIAATCPLAQWTHERGTDRRPSLSIRVEPEQRSPCRCWSCGFEGGLRKLGEELVAKGGEEYAPLLARILETEKQGGGGKWVGGIDAVAVNQGELLPGIEEYPDDLIMGEEEYAEFKGRVPIYAMDRGLSLTSCRCWELGHDRQRKRLLFPVRDWRGFLVGVSGRTYVNGCETCGAVLDKDYGVCTSCGTVVQGKYLHTTGYRRDMVLYGEHKYDRDWPTGILVEGNLDVVKLWQWGYRNVVASFGSGVSEGQLRRLAFFFKKLVVVGDGDKAGEKMMTTVQDALSERMEVVTVKLPKDVDPGGMSAFDADFFLKRHSLPIDRDLKRFV